MERINRLTRIVACLLSYDEFESVDDANSKLFQQVEEIQNRVFAVYGTNSPEHIFINTDDLSESFVWIYFYSETDLEEIDKFLLEYSQDFNGEISVIDFDNDLYQTYDSGEHEDGVFGQPEKAEIYRKSIHNDYNNLNSQYSLMKFPMILK